MSATEDYLTRLRQQLKGFSAREQEDLMAEIQSHIESGQSDLALGGDPEQRQGRLLAELGSPDDLGKGFQAVHRPNRWLDFFLIVIPIYFVFPLLTLLAFALLGTSPNQLNAEVLAFGIRLAVVLSLAFCLVGFWRRSTILLAFWIPDTAMRLVSQLMREHFTGLTALYQPAIPFETWAWAALLIALLVALARFLWKNRRDSLILTFATLPLWELMINLGAYWFAQANALPWPSVYWNLFGFLDLENLIGVVSLAGFCLLDRRELRWFALLFGIAYFSVVNAYRFWPNPLLVVWSSLLLILLIAWLYDQRRQFNKISV